MPTKQIASSTLWQIASQATMALLSAVSAKFVAMALSQELAGHYNSVYGYLQVFSILADFGLYAVSVREVSAAKEKSRVLGALLSIRLCIAALSLGGAVLIASLVPAWHGTPLPTGVAITAFVPFFTLLAGVLRTVFQIHYRMQYVFIAEVSQRILTVTGMTAAILFGIRGSHDPAVLYYFFWVGPAGSLLLLSLSVFFSSRIMLVRPVFDRALLLHLLRQAVPYGVAFLCIALYRQFDLTMIALLREDFPIQNAYYGFATRVAEMTYLVPTFLLNSTLPILSERASKGESTADLLGRTLLALVAISGASCLFAFFWSRPIMQVLTTDRYLASAAHAGSDTALHLLALPMFCNALVLFSFYVLLTRNAWKPLVFTMLVGVAASMGLNLLWIPEFGFTGAIQTSAVVQAGLAVLLLPQAFRIMRVRLEWGQTARVGFFLAAIGICSFLTASLPVTTFQSALALLAGAALAALLGYLTGLHNVFRIQEASA